MCAVSKPASSIARSIASGAGRSVTSSTSGGPPAWPTSVGASTSWWRSSSGSTRSQVRQVSVKPCRRTSGGPEPPRCDGVKVEGTRRRLATGTIGSPCRPWRTSRLRTSTSLRAARAAARARAGGVGAGARRLARHAARAGDGRHERRRRRSPSTTRASPPAGSSGRACSRSTAPSTAATARRSPAPFRLDAVRERFTAVVAEETERLIDAFAPARRAELRRSFAGPLAAAVGDARARAAWHRPGGRARLVRRRSSRPSTSSRRAAR